MSKTWPSINYIMGLPPVGLEDDPTLFELFKKSFPILKIKSLRVEVSEDNQIQKKTGVDSPIYQFAALNEGQMTITHNNEYGESLIEEAFKGLAQSNTMNELHQFGQVNSMLGNVTRNVTNDLKNKIYGTYTSALENTLSANSDLIPKNVAASAYNLGEMVVAGNILGAHIDFPNIWKNSNSDYGINVTIDLRTISTDDKNYEKYILNPLHTLMALSLPDANVTGSGVAFTNPPYLEAEMHGIFHSDLCGISNFSINMPYKELSTWNSRPHHVIVNLTIKDMYNIIVYSDGTIVNNDELPTSYKILGKKVGLNKAEDNKAKTSRTTKQKTKSTKPITHLSEMFDYNINNSENPPTISDINRQVSDSLISNTSTIKNIDAVSQENLPTGTTNGNIINNNDTIGLSVNTPIQNLSSLKTNKDLLKNTSTLNSIIDDSILEINSLTLKPTKNNKIKINSLFKNYTENSNILNCIGNINNSFINNIQKLNNILEKSKLNDITSLSTTSLQNINKSKTTIKNSLTYISSEILKNPELKPFYDNLDLNLDPLISEINSNINSSDLNFKTVENKLSDILQNPLLLINNPNETSLNEIKTDTDNIIFTSNEYFKKNKLKTNVLIENGNLLQQKYLEKENTIPRIINKIDELNYSIKQIDYNLDDISKNFNSKINNMIEINNTIPKLLSV